MPLGADAVSRVQVALAGKDLATAEKAAATIQSHLEGQQSRPTTGGAARIKAPEIKNPSSVGTWGSGVPGSEGWNEQHRVDPARDFPTAPPNFGRWAIPQVLTYQGIVASISKAYRNWDEAVKDSPDNARFMRNDPSVMECIKARQRCTSLLDWHLEIDGPEMPAHQALTERMTRILKHTPRFTEYRRCLLEAIWFGKYANQHRFGWHLKGGESNIVIDAWMPVHGDKIVFRMDDGKNQYPRDQIGFRVGMQYRQGDLIDGRKLEATQAGLATFLAPYERHLAALHKHEIEDAAYETPLDAGSVHGVGIRSQIYWCWFQ
ncbi:MAG: phage portal protein family protein, partial [Candidatus Dormibacteria bacterium]